MNNFNDPRNEYFPNTYREKEDEIDLLDLLLVLLKNKKLIIGITLFFTCGALIASYIITPVYSSSTTVLLSRSDESIFIDKSSTSVRSVSTFTPELITKLFSTNNVISKTKASLSQKGKGSTVALQATLDNKTQVITLTATADTPNIAATAANQAVTIAQLELESLIQNQNAQITQLENTISLEINDVRKNISEKEKDFAYYIQKTTSSKEKAAQLYSFSKSENAPNAAALYELPDGGLEYLRHLREISLLENQYHMLQQRKTALAELKRPIDIMVLEEAIPHLSPIKPKRSILVAIATTLGLFLSVFAAFTREFFRNANNDPERAQKLAAIRKSLSFKK